MIKQAPLQYNGYLNELYEEWAKSVLLESSIVEEFHRQFCAYLESSDPIFLVRKVRGQLRGQTLRNECGAQMRPTDNSPAWWIHYQLFSGQFSAYSSFATFIEAIPSHMFEVDLPDNINKAGWHVAHIFDAKNGDVKFRSWDRAELVRRSIRNIHPCNYFYIPKIDWQRHGGNSDVIAFFYEKFESKYRTVWKDFLRLVKGVPFPNGKAYQYAFPAHEGTEGFGGTSHQQSPSDFATQYSYSRLCFKADHIERLGMEDTFCIVTEKDGTFAMTKRQFYDTFPDVVKSKSYKIDRKYHYPKPPKKASSFRIL